MITVYIICLIIIIIGASAFFGAPYVPTKRRDLRRMFDNLYNLQPSDCVLDLGSGDGMVLREVARRGARGVGYEINPILLGISILISWLFKLNHKISFKLKDAWTADFPSGVTLVYAFAVQRDEKRLVVSVQRAANKLGRPLSLICYGSPLKTKQPTKTFEAYALYNFKPLKHPNP